MIRELSLTVTMMTVAFVSPASSIAIVIRHDRADELYIKRATGYECVVSVGNAHGTLIAPDWILTAAHTVVGLNPFTNRMTIGGNPNGIRRLVMHPTWSGGLPPGYAELEWVDMALIQLDRPVPHIIPARLYTSDDEAGEIATLVGTGTTGDGHTSPLHRDGKLRAADNRVDRVDDHWLYFPFDAPPDALEFEGVSGKGDSGGPALLRRDNELFVAGVCSRNDDYGEGKNLYNTTDVYTRVSTQIGWIQRVMDGVDESGLPRPAYAETWLNSPAGSAARAFLRAINDDDPGALLTFEKKWRLPEELQTMPAENRVVLWKSLRKRAVHLTPVSVIATTPHRLYIVVQCEDRQRVIDIFTARESEGEIITTEESAGKIRDIRVSRMRPPPREPNASPGAFRDDSLGSLRAALESITSLTASEFRTFSSRLHNLLDASTSRGQRISLLSLGVKLIRLGPDDLADKLRRFLMDELVTLASQSPRARTLLQSSFLPRLADYPQCEHEARARRYDADIAACLKREVAREIQADLAWLPLNLRVEMNRTMDSTWLNDEQRASTIVGIQRFVAMWGDVAATPDLTYRQLAERALYELNHLPMGEELIDPVLRDVDESELRISDYRGRVVVLTFWTTWCIPCMAAIPAEKAMCERLAGEPFTFLGVSSDPTPEKAKDTVNNRSMPWRNIWSPITSDGLSFVGQLMIRSWPTIIVLDAAGRMRFRFGGSPLRSSHTTADVEKAVRILLDEMKNPKGTSS